jgi:hypothetical protein
MCTITTIDRNFWLENKQLVIARVLADARLNPDGWAAVGVDADQPDADFNLQSMRIAPILSMVESFFLGCSVYGRVFVHSRFATTSRVGIAFNHAFTNHRGTIVMHNGIVDNYASLAVDSFNLIDYPMHSAPKLLDMLTDDQEMFANIFLIRPDDGTYGVVRLMSGQLHTDGQGNYSSYPMGMINIPVNQNTSYEHDLGRAVRIPETKAPSYLYDDLVSDEEWQEWLNDKEFKKSS